MSFKNASVFKVGATNEEYQKQEHPRGHQGFVVSSSSLKEFAHCPSRWFAGYEPPESAAKTWGSLLDCLLTTPDEFEHRFAVQPAEYKDDKTGDLKPWNGNSNVCKKWKTAHADMEVVSDKTFQRASLAVLRIMKDPVIKAWCEASDRQVWVKGEWHDKETNRIIPVRCLIDWLPRLDTEFAKSMGDLKCIRSASLLPFQRQVYQMGWHIQAAFNLDLYLAAKNEDRPNWCFILQENYDPFEPAKRLLSESFIELGRAAYRRMLHNYCKCLTRGYWPGYDDHDEAIQGSWSLVQPEPWMESAETFAPKFEFGEDEEEEDEDAPPDMPH